MGAGQQELSLAGKHANHARKSLAVELGINIVHHHREPVAALSFQMEHGRQPKSSRNDLDLPRAQNLLGGLIASVDAQIVAMRAFAAVARVAVTNPSRIIPFSVRFFHFFGAFRPIQPPLPAVSDGDLGKAGAAKRR